MSFFFRDSKGEVSALEDRCSHRFAPLSIGRHTGDGVRITRWYLDEDKIAPYLRGFETFEGKVDRWNIYDLEPKGNIFNMDSGSAPAGLGAPDGVFVPEAMLFHATQMMAPET